jgi:DNA replication and repair protein RecF
MIDALTPHLQDSYNSISTKKKMSLSYKSSTEGASTNSTTNKECFIESLNKVRNQERERGLSLVGPHRDDLLLNLGEQPVKGYASHGESWSVALSLRLASFYLMKSEGAQPILILDDVFSELDESRRDSLTRVTKEAEQSLITVAVANDLPTDIDGSRYLVTSGHVRRV